MQELIKHLPAVLYEYVIYPDGARRFNYVSDAAQSILGLSPQAITQDSTVLDAIVHKDDINNLYETSSVSETAGSEWNWHGRMWVGTTLKWMEFRSNHELKKDGSIVRRGIIQDITDRKQRADKSEEKHLESIERLPIGIIIHKRGR